MTRGARRTARRTLAGAFVAGAIVAACSGESSSDRQPAVPTTAPDTFQLRLETSRGPIVIEVIKAWAPIGADRIHALAAEGFFDESRFFRVLPGFVAQWGVHDENERNAAWDAKPIADDPVKGDNVRGTVTFAHSGPGTRSHQLFINLGDNSRLDTLGFAPVGRVVEGMERADSIYSGYREKPDYHLISTLGNSYLRRMFPKLDYIERASIVTR
jgi:peptidyl-prolyl cis-trans isomerase A (cyclophilin A)